ncbi:hypothetical protein [Tautonia rosea]|uniref:hypothetical protein n=1 Tax=Tautonia rosea TaxID=2728037 RepID=UPI0014752F98|nr:hypothetical protein [Tautonia rosea]
MAMTTSRIGLVLRLIGPVLEIVCIGLLLGNFGRNRSLFGQPAEPLLYFGVALGLAMVALGLGLSTPRPGRRPRQSSQSSRTE